MLFALLAGFCSAFSPCVAPVLPLYVLRGVRPWRLASTVAGAIAVMMIASVYVLHGLGEVGAWIGMAGTIVAGTLLLTERFELWASRWSGLWVGLAWAPCLGPIAAGILALGGLTSPVMVVAYCAGLGVGVGLCATAANRIRARFTGRARQALGVVLILTGIGFGIGNQLGVAERLQASFPAWNGVLWKWQDQVVGGLDVRVAPGWRGKWAATPAELRGRRSLVVIWSYTCPACEVGMRRVRELAAKHNLQVVLIHSPQYAGATDRRRTKATARRYGLADAPLLFDDDRRTMELWGATRWPWYAVVDERGRITATRSGSRVEALEPAILGGEGPEEGDFSRPSDRWAQSGSWREEAGSLVAGRSAGLELDDGGLLWIERRNGGYISVAGQRLPLTSSGWIHVDGRVAVSPGVRISAWRVGETKTAPAPEATSSSGAASSSTDSLGRIIIGNQKD